MISIQAIGREVQTRREAIGLTQARLARLAGLSRQTLPRLEAGTIKDLSFQRVTNLLEVLGLSFDAPTITARQRKNGLWMAAKTSSVSYRRELTSDELRRALASGEVPHAFESNLVHFLDEAPIPLVVMAVEEAAQQEAIATARIWANLGKMAVRGSATRRNSS